MDAARVIVGVAVVCIVCAAASGGDVVREERVRRVAGMKGLVAFWDFDHAVRGVWSSYHDAGAVDRSFPLYLRRIGDEKQYAIDRWPYADESSKLTFDDSGPFGRAVRFDRGYIYGAVPRSALDGTALDIRGRMPFTMIAWVKFVGRRHLVAGIWDEGGWNKYAGRRQVALFAGLFGRKGVTAHISATGAASFPQSRASGSQYARQRALDGASFQNNRWVAMAMTYDPDRREVVAHLNGETTPLKATDSVARDVYPDRGTVSANPFAFPSPIYAPRAFTLKYNGYDMKTSPIREHRVFIDLERRTIAYERDTRPGTRISEKYRVVFDVARRGRSVYGRAATFAAEHGREVRLPRVAVAYGDEVRTSLELADGRAWRRVGTEVRRAVTEGAPFTVGRALGLGSEELGHGSQLFVDGVAVFDRVLSGDELQDISLVER